MSVHRKLIRLAALLLVSAALAAPPAEGDHVGTLRFTDAAGKTIALDQPGVLYVVDFWALGCQPCIQEMRALERLAGEYADRALFVGVAWGDWKPKELGTLAKLAGTFQPVYADSENWLGQFGIRSFPTKLFIKDGVVRKTHVGAGPNSYDVIKDMIEAELTADGH